MKIKLKYRNTRKKNASFSGISMFKEKLFDEVSPQTLGIFRIILGAGLIYEAVRIKIMIPKYYLNPEFYIKWDFFSNIPVFSASTLYLFTGILFISALLITVGLIFRIAVVVYLLIYIYFLMAEASYYNNHYYFIALLLFIMLFTHADNYFSVRHYIFKKQNGIQEESIPAWNYSILRFQIFIVYFLAGIVKLNLDWISTNTFRCVMQYGTEYPKDSTFYHSDFAIYFLTFGGLLFDLIVPFLLLNKKTRIIAVPAILIFHSINAATLNIGVFPYLMAGCTIVFFRYDLVDYWKHKYRMWKDKHTNSYKMNFVMEPVIVKGVFSKRVYYALILYCIVQILLPYRHLLIPGNVGWTGEGNNFSWRMKMGLKAPTRFELYVHNKSSGKEYKPTININPHQYSSLWICPNRIIQVAEYVGSKTSMQFNIPKDSLFITCKADLIYNNHPPTAIFDTSVNLLEVKVNKWGHSSFITETPLPIQHYYWLSDLFN